MREKSVDVFGLTDRGRVRAENQDHFLIAEVGEAFAVRRSSAAMLQSHGALPSEPCQVLAVADGMGGHAAGQEASRLSVATAAEHLANTLPALLREQDSEAVDPALLLEDALRHCHRVLVEEASPQNQNMGTTMTIGCVIWPRLHLAHVGDSRCYLLRDGVVSRMTRDQTVAQQLVDEGRLDASDVAG